MFNKKLIFKVVATLIALFLTVYLVAFAVITVEKKYIYPIKFGEEVGGAAKKYGLDAALILSVIKTESGFNEKAVSYKGAIGLMQIMPETGEYIAQKRGIYGYDLFSYKDNIDFGCYYLSYLTDKFAGTAETLAAYNAGEGTVRKWLKNSEYSKDGKSLDTIPYGETKNYVDKILKSLKRYRKLYGKLLDKL